MDFECSDWSPSALIAFMRLISSPFRYCLHLRSKASFSAKWLTIRRPKYLASLAESLTALIMALMILSVISRVSDRHRSVFARRTACSRHCAASTRQVLFFDFVWAKSVEISFWMALIWFESHITSRIEWKHFSHFSRIKTFSLPDSDIRALIAGSIQGTSVSLRLLKTSDKTSIAAPEIRELKMSKLRFQLVPYRILLQWWIMRFVSSTALGCTSFELSLAISRI